MTVVGGLRKTSHNAHGAVHLPITPEGRRVLPQIHLGLHVHCSHRSSFGPFGGFFLYWLIMGYYGRRITHIAIRDAVGSMNYLTLLVYIHEDTMVVLRRTQSWSYMW